jgi:hypothetical protein
MEEIELIKPSDVHLGFSIAGGISHEYVKGFVLFKIKINKFKKFSY